MTDAIQVMDDQQRVGIKIFCAFRDELSAPLHFNVLKRTTAPRRARDLNAAMFDQEILFFPNPMVRCTWHWNAHTHHHDQSIADHLETELLRDLDPAPLFDMTRYVRLF